MLKLYEKSISREKNTPKKNMKDLFISSVLFVSRSRMGNEVQNCRHKKKEESHISKT